MVLKLELGKAGGARSKLNLNLNKGTRFVVELFWDSKEDLDAHALLATNVGNGAKIDDLRQILSTYNVRKNNPQGALLGNTDGSFETPEGALHHSGDARTGVDRDVDEIITIDGSKIPEGVNEIPIFVTIHEASESGLTFDQVTKAGIRIKDGAGKELAHYVLSGEFARFNAVQMGSLCLGEHGWEFAPIGAGFNGDFNTVLSNFS